MDFEEYQQLAMRTKSVANKQDGLLLGALGIAGESGEVAEHVKKHRFHGRMLDEAALKAEIGDVLWYLALLADVLDTDLGAIAAANIEKLKARYPSGFVQERPALDAFLGRWICVQSPFCLEIRANGGELGVECLGMSYPATYDAEAGVLVWYAQQMLLAHQCDKRSGVLLVRCPPSTEVLEYTRIA